MKKLLRSTKEQAKCCISGPVEGIVDQCKPGKNRATLILSIEWTQICLAFEYGIKHWGKKIFLQG